MHKKPILYVFIEIKVRELEGRTLLALEAASQGFQVVIGNIRNLYPILQKGLLPKGICYEKSLTRGKEQKLETLKKKGYIIVCQDEETGLAQNNFEEFLSFRSTSETVKLAKAIFCFGKFDHNYWTRQYSDYKDKIHITGSPRFDYWLPKFKSYYNRQIKWIKNHFNRFILVSSNFGLVNGYYSLSDLIAQGKKNGSIQSNKDEEKFKMLYSDTKEMFMQFIEMIKHLALSLKDVEIIVRPHPSEKISIWETALDGINNIHVVFKDSITPWVLSSCAILHNGCTTAIEAYVTDVPAIAYVPNESLVNREIPNRLSIKCISKNDVSKTMKKILNGKNIKINRTAENDQIIQDRILHSTHTTSAIRIVDIMQKFDLPRSLPIRNSFLLRNYHLIPPKWNSSFMKWKKWVKESAKSILQKLRHYDTKSFRKFPGLELFELKQIQDDLESVTTRYKRCKIRKLVKNVFVIEQK